MTLINIRSRLALKEKIKHLRRMVRQLKEMSTYMKMENSRARIKEHIYLLKKEIKATKRQLKEIPRVTSLEDIPKQLNDNHRLSGLEGICGLGRTSVMQWRSAYLLGSQWNSEGLNGAFPSVNSTSQRPIAPLDSVEYEVTIKSPNRNIDPTTAQEGKEKKDECLPSNVKGVTSEEKVLEKKTNNTTNFLRQSPLEASREVADRTVNPTNQGPAGPIKSDENLVGSESPNKNIDSTVTQENDKKDARFPLGGEGDIIPEVQENETNNTTNFWSETHSNIFTGVEFPIANFTNQLRISPSNGGDNLGTSKSPDINIVSTTTQEERSDPQSGPSKDKDSKDKD